jgi:predicted DsbA family dithiol-disulfide isomerase
MPGAVPCAVPASQGGTIWTSSGQNREVNSKYTDMSASPTLLIDVVSDLVSPWCYLGVRRMEQALSALQGASIPEMHWRPFEINPALPKDGMDVDRYLASVFGSPQAGRAVLDQVANLGEQEGIRFDFNRVRAVPNTMDAHRLILMATDEGHGSRMAHRLFRGFFEEGLDIGRAEVLTDLGLEAGLELDSIRECLSSDRYRDMVRVTESQVRQSGLSGVPSFVINGRVAVSGVHDPQVLVSAIDKALFGELPEDPEPGQLH